MSNTLAKKIAQNPLVQKFREVAKNEYNKRGWKYAAVFVASALTASAFLGPMNMVFLSLFAGIPSSTYALVIQERIKFRKVSTDSERIEMDRCQARLNIALAISMVSVVCAVVATVGVLNKNRIAGNIGDENLKIGRMR